MTKSDNGAASKKTKGRRGPRFTVQYSEDILQKVEEERIKRGYNTSSPIYQEAIKFYFDNKEKRIFMDQKELDEYESKKLEDLLTDRRRLAAIEKILAAMKIKEGKS